MSNYAATYKRFIFDDEGKGTEVQEPDTTMASASAPLVKKAQLLIAHAEQLHKLCMKLDAMQEQRVAGTLKVKLSASQYTISSTDDDLIDKLFNELKAEIADMHKKVMELAADICGKTL